MKDQLKTALIDAAFINLMFDCHQIVEWVIFPFANRNVKTIPNCNAHEIELHCEQKLTVEGSRQKMRRKNRSETKRKFWFDELMTRTPEHDHQSRSTLASCRLCERCFSNALLWWMKIYFVCHFSRHFKIEGWTSEWRHRHAINLVAFFLLHCFLSFAVESMNRKSFQKWPTKCFRSAKLKWRKSFDCRRRRHQLRIRRSWKRDD